MYVTLDFIRNRLVKLLRTQRKQELQNENKKFLPTVGVLYLALLQPCTDLS